MRRRGMAPPTVVKDSEMSLAVVFDVPPLGDAHIGESDHRQLGKLQDNIRQRHAGSGVPFSTGFNG